MGRISFLLKKSFLQYDRLVMVKNPHAIKIKRQPSQTLGKNRLRLPVWLKKPISKHQQGQAIREILQHDSIHTVCESAKCPNRGECFSRKTVTFMVLGNQCTRTCGFCAVTPGKPQPLNAEEPDQVAQAAKRLGLKHVVITSVNRDDLPDGGATHFAKVISAVRQQLPSATIEVLTPDFKGNSKAWHTIFMTQPDVFNHNVETIPEFYSFVRPQADYQQSLDILRAAKKARMAQVKSGLMLGFGESWEQILRVLEDLKQAGVDVVTIGQYIQPSLSHLDVKKYYTPQEFEGLAQVGKAMGFRHVFSAPLVRSSYNAEEQMLAAQERVF